MITVEYRNEKIFALQVGEHFVDIYDVDWNDDEGLACYVGGGPEKHTSRGVISRISDLQEFLDHHGIVEVGRAEWCEECKCFYADEEIGQCGHPREEE